MAGTDNGFVKNKYIVMFYLFYKWPKVVEIMVSRYCFGNLLSRK